MKALRIIFICFTIIMFVAILTGLLDGSFFDEGGQIVELLWGKITMIDIYISFLIVWLWIFVREDKKWVAILWLPPVLLLGSLTTSLYITIALFKSDNMKEVLLGKN